MSGSCYTLLYGGETEPKTWGNYYRASFYREPREEDGGEGGSSRVKKWYVFFEWGGGRVEYIKVKMKIIS